MLKAVVFDCDGVIVDSEPLSDEAWRVVLARYGHGATREELVATTGRSDSATYDLFAASADLPSRGVFLDEVMEECRRLFSTVLDPFPDAIDAVKTLALHGIPMAVATSSPRRNLDIKLDRFDLHRYFDVTVAGDEVPAQKPAPDCYLMAASFLRIDPAECLVVEDSAVGAEAAATAGMRVVVVARGRGELVPGFPSVSEVDAAMLLTFMGRE